MKSKIRSFQVAAVMTFSLALVIASCKKDNQIADTNSQDDLTPGI